MPLSAKFRREMLTALKTAKKNKEQQSDPETSEKEAVNNLDDNDVVRSASILSKPVSSTRALKIDDNSNTDTRKPDKQSPIK